MIGSVIILKQSNDKNKYQEFVKAMIKEMQLLVDHLFSK